jgi:hypothetical protein
MSKSRYLLNKHTVSELFTIVYVVLDDYLKVARRMGCVHLPESEQQKGSYAELMSIALVGDLLNQADVGLWYRLVKSEYKALFPVLPDESRYYRILKNLERVWADFALCLTANHEVIAYAVDSKPLPVCKFKRHKRDRAMAESTVGFSTQGPVYGFKLHALTATQGPIVKFAIVPAHEADPTVAKVLLCQDALDLTLGDKAYVGCGIYTPPKDNALNPGFWSPWLDKARKTIESVFSTLVRTKHLVLGQRNSFWSIRAHVCRKIAAHNLACLFTAF